MSRASDEGGSLAQKPLVSVCVATFNQRAYIRDAVMSVLAQHDPAVFGLEILIGDDCSTDGTAAIVRELAAGNPEVISVVTHGANVGAAGNYLALMARARGDFVAHLDGDDYWLPGKLLAQLAFLDAHPECIASYTNAVVMDAQGILLGAFSNPQPQVIDLDYLLARGNFLNHSSLLYRACALDVLKGLAPPFIDYMMHVKLAQLGHLGLLAQSRVVYRRMTATSMLRNQFMLVDALYRDAILSAAADVPEAVRYRCCATYIVVSLGARPRLLAEREFRSGVRALLRRLGVDPFRLVFYLGSALLLATRLAMSAGLSRLLNHSLTVVHPRL